MFETDVRYREVRAIVGKLYDISRQFGNTNPHREGWIDWALSRMAVALNCHTGDSHQRILWCPIALGWTDRPFPHSLHFCLATYAIRDRSIPSPAIAGFCAAAAVQVAPREYELLIDYLRNCEHHPWETER